MCCCCVHETNWHDDFDDERLHRCYRLYKSVSGTETWRRPISTDTLSSGAFELPSYLDGANTRYQCLIRNFKYYPTANHKVTLEVDISDINSVDNKVDLGLFHLGQQCAVSLQNAGGGTYYLLVQIAGFMGTPANGSILPFTPKDYYSLKAEHTFLFGESPKRMSCKFTVDGFELNNVEYSFVPSDTVPGSAYDFTVNYPQYQYALVRSLLHGGKIERFNLSSVKL